MLSNVLGFAFIGFLIALYVSPRFAMFVLDICIRITSRRNRE